MGIAGMDGPAPYYAIGYMTFNKLEQFQDGMKVNGKILTDDMPNYTRDVIVQIGEVMEVFQTAR